MKKLSKASFGTTPVHFEAVLGRALQEERQPMKRKHYRAIVVMAVLIIAMACTALAVTMSQSAKFSKVQAAREAVMEKYGLTVDTMGIFAADATQRDGAWTIVFSPLKYITQGVGQYTVVLSEDGAAEASWTYDDTDPAVYASGSLDAEVWGQAQLEAAQAVSRAYYENYIAMESTAAAEMDDMAKLERRAQADQVLYEAQRQGMDVFVLNLVPGAEDLTPMEAVALAKQAVTDKYGVPVEALDQYAHTLMFLKYQSKDEPMYRVSLGHYGEDSRLFYVSFGIDLFSPSGEIYACKVGCPLEDWTLPDGPLDTYQEAVREYVEEGAFDLRAPAEKAEIAARMEAAGFGEYLEGRRYIEPETDDLPEADALLAAEAALVERCGFTEDTLSLFSPIVSMQQLESGRAWVFSYSPAKTDDWPWDFAGKMGDYQIILDAQTGTLLEAAWSLEESRDSAAYTARTFGRAKAYDTSLLPYVQALLGASEPFYEKYRTVYEILTWSLEDSAAHDQLFRDAGFNPEYYPNGLPGQGDLTEEAAIEAAKEALQKEFGVTAERLETAIIEPAFHVNNPERHVWYLRASLFDGGHQDTFDITLDAVTGEIINIEYDTGVGNG